jgi:hypothetical protein
MQRDRRRDPYPWTWEVPALAIGTILLVIVSGIQLGRSIANLVAGGGWTWPDTSTGSVPSLIGTAFWTSLPAIIRGDADAGLFDLGAGQAGPALLGVSVVLTEAVLLTGTIWAGIHLYKRGPGRIRGMATPAESEKLLGITRLRKAASIIRPDLHGSHRLRSE